MGREVRRVPLDFSWPIGKTWEGFLNPNHRPCPEEAKGLCDGGYTMGGKWLDSIARLITIIGEEAISEPHAAQLRARGRTYPHPYLTGWPQAPHIRQPPYRLASFGGGEELGALVRGLAKKRGEELGSFAGSGVSYEIGQTLLKAAGIKDKDWGTCKVCGGDAIDPAVKEAYEAWRETPPPKGDAWQMWETTSEGSAISPPKATPEELARWLADNGASAFGDSGASYDSWLRMIVGSGWAPSAVSVGGGPIVSGVEGLSSLDRGNDTKGGT